MGNYCVPIPLLQCWERWDFPLRWLPSLLSSSVGQSTCLLETLYGGGKCTYAYPRIYQWGLLPLRSRISWLWWLGLQRPLFDYYSSSFNKKSRYRIICDLPRILIKGVLILREGVKLATIGVLCRQIIIILVEWLLGCWEHSDDVLFFKVKKLL